MLAFAVLAVLLATAAARVEKEPTFQCGSGWVATGRADPVATHTVKLVLASQNAETLKSIALAVSDPRSPLYGEYLSKDEVNELTAPRAEDVAAVADWLDHAEVFYTIDSVQGTIVIRDTVSKIEELFKTQISDAYHVTTKQAVLRAGDYEVPAALEDAIVSVFGMHGLPLPPRVFTPASDASGAVRSVPAPVTPDVLAKAYKIAGVKASGSLKNRQAVAEFVGQLMNDTDLATFFEKYLPSVPANDTKVYAHHGSAKQGFGMEADLDIQYIMGVAPGIKTEFYEQLNMKDFCGDMHNWTQLLLATEDVPLVHSISYGWQGEFALIGCQESDIRVIDTDLQKLAARGVSIIFASGDSGSGYTPDSPLPAPCSAGEPDSREIAFTGTALHTKQVSSSHGSLACCMIAREIGEREKYAGWSFVPSASGNVGTCTVFASISHKGTKAGATSGLFVPVRRQAAPSPSGKLYPSWPASSPWVTAVGATRFINDVSGGPEGATKSEDLIGSGGGFSTMWEVAEWQKEAIAHYFKTVDPSTLPDKTKVSYPAGGRGTPDVSALGTGFQVIDHAGVVTLDGTSASAPTFAAIVSLLNEARLNAGKKPLGFLNPWIYQHADAFTDITYGWDRVGRGGLTLAAGFNCSAGWDPITGVGTPIFPKLLAAALATK